MCQVVATIDGRPLQAGDRYTLSNQTPRPAAVARTRLRHRSKWLAADQIGRQFGQPPFGIRIAAAVSNAINLLAPR
jgi:hypothetical protein